jgi:hypothetical protein
VFFAGKFYRIHNFSVIVRFNKNFSIRIVRCFLFITKTDCSQWAYANKSKNHNVHLFLLLQGDLAGICEHLLDVCLDSDRGWDNMSVILVMFKRPAEGANTPSAQLPAQQPEFETTPGPSCTPLGCPVVARGRGRGKKPAV